MGRRASSRPWAALACCAVALASWGCSSRGSLHVVPLSEKRLNPTGALLREIRPGRTAYWLDDEGRLCLAVGDGHRSLLGPVFSRSFSASLVLGPPPAGESRTYTVDRRTLRHVEDAGFSHLRSASLSGMVTVWNYGRGRLRCRVRLTVKQQAFWVLSGWGGDTQVLWVGEFAARCDPTWGKQVLALTEEGAMARPAVEAAGAARLMRRLPPVTGDGG